ncbi:MAG: hypothetical protein LAT57_05090 [Balneolales bacterium]|nr:hypothetical protein [Balneolales bacterium]
MASYWKLYMSLDGDRTDDLGDGADNDNNNGDGDDSPGEPNPSIPRM